VTEDILHFQSTSEMPRKQAQGMALGHGPKPTRRRRTIVTERTTTESHSEFCDALPNSLVRNQGLD
jgi:hypothetical protein